MKGAAFGEESVVSSVDEVDQPRAQGRASVTRQICRAAGPAQQLLQLACPVFDLDQGLQFAQMVGKACSAPCGV
jgi:hypothetical protein